MVFRLRKVLVGDLLGVALIYVLFWVSGMAARIGEELSRHRFSGYWMLFCPILLVALVVLTFSQLVRNGITLRLLAGALAGLGSSFIALFVSASYDVGAMVLIRQLGFLGVLLVYGSVSFWSLGWLFGSLSAGAGYWFQGQVGRFLGESPDPVGT